MRKSLRIDSPFMGAGMPKAYSRDLRERVITAVETGASRREAAERFADVLYLKARVQSKPPVRSATGSADQRAIRSVLDCRTTGVRTLPRLIRSVWGSKME
jgi:hypothetical protein